MSQRDLKSSATPGIAHWLIHRAARAAPECLSARLEEEWLADLAARSSAMSRLRFAIGCCWATQVIAYEHQPSPVPVSSTVVAGKTLAAYAEGRFGFLSPRSSTFFLVLSLHALLLYAFMTALSHTHGTAIPDPLQNQELKNPVPHELRVPPPDPQLNRVPIEVPKPPADLQYEQDPNIDVTTRLVPDPPSPPNEILSPPQPHTVSRIQGGAGTGFPRPDDFYPESARRLEEQGNVIVQVCVDAKGHLTSDPTTLQSAGSPRLDEGALKLARAGSGHYRATTEDGQPVNSCYPLRIRFELKN
jgi:TonB family protein